jgi:serine/threonine protein kinase
MWENDWQIVDKDSRQCGGQATVIKVQKRSDQKIFACLKQFHSEHSDRTERRFRMQEEAIALIALEGNGAPRYLASNIEHWNKKGVPLYIIMEWVEGPTLTNIVSKGPCVLNDALTIISTIIKTVEECHKLKIHHRDLKPDNIILKEGEFDKAVLLDFGMAWSKSDKDKNREFDTPKNQELGNRFLRLPEFAPGKDLHDHRSDITMIIGLLFYLLAGRAPRLLVDEKGHMPHEAAEIDFPTNVLDDPRWPRLKRVFDRGFQTKLDLRFQSTKELADKLADLNPSSEANENNLLEAEIEEINDVLISDSVKMAKFREDVLDAGGKAFKQTFDDALLNSGFYYYGSGPGLTDAQTSNITFHLIRKGTSDLSAPKANFCHLITISQNSVIAKVQIENGQFDDYYTGDITDVDGLIEAVQKKAKWVVIQLLSVMKRKLSQYYKLIS